LFSAKYIYQIGRPAAGTQRSAWAELLPRGLVILLLALAVGACSTARFVPRPLDAPGDFSGMQSKTIDGVSVSVAILTDTQAQSHFGVDLGRLQLQAVWISVRNPGTRKLWFIRSVLDADIYAAEEVALMAADGLEPKDYERLRAHLHDQSLRSLLLPGMITEGFVYLPRSEGGKYLDIRLSGDAYDEAELRERAVRLGNSTLAGAPQDLRFGFAVPLPDGDFDYERLDAERIYADRDLPDLDAAGLRSALEQLACCTTNEDGSRNGDPLNIVLVGDSADVLNALSRSGWSFTHRITLRSIRREIEAAIGSGAYPVAPISSLYALGRSQDVALQRARRSIAQRNHLRLWLAPYRFEGRQVWIGQISRDIGIKLTTKSPTLTTHIVDPEVDVAREYLLHSLVATGLIDRFGFVKGSVRAAPDAPAQNLTDDPYFSDGMRLVLIIARDPVPPDLIRSLRWERSAAPIAQGQSAAALRNVRPIEAQPADHE
jgi:hypothetical protein